MSIQTKVIAVAVFAVALFGVSDFVVQQIAVVPSFRELEQQEAKQDLAHWRLALAREIYHLDQFCYDWSAWDDTYAYVADRNREYEASNLVTSTFTDNVLSMLFVLDNSGGVVWGRVCDTVTGETFLMPDFAADAWEAEHPLLGHEKETDSKSGIISTSRGLMLVSSRPIVTSDVEGPPRGTLVMGKFLGEEVLDAIYAQTHVLAAILPTKTLASETVQADGDGYQVAVLSESELLVSTLIPDVYGNLSIELSASLPRKITARGYDAMRLDALGALAVGAVSLLMLISLMRRTVISPLVRIKQHVARIAGSGELAMVELRGTGDEFDMLGESFNRMIERLEHDAQVRAEAEAALRNSEARFEILLDSLQNVVWSATLDGQSLLYLNPAIENIYGRSVQEFMDNSRLWLEAVHPEDRKRVEEASANIFNTGRCELEYRVVRPDGHVRWMHERKSVICNEDGVPIRIGGIATDVTELRAMYAQVATTRHLAELGELGASIAHEIRNPLAGISGALQVIRDGLPEGDRREVVLEALSQVDRVEQTVNQVLRYARTWEANSGDADLRAFAQLFAESSGPRLLAEQHRLSVETGPPLNARFDPGLLEEVLTNAVMNAVQAMPDVGAVTIGFEETPTMVRLMVRDNGPGFAAGQAEKATEPFFTTKARGTGLGLSICRRLAEAQGGALYVGNGKDGAEVVIELPKEEPA